MSNGTVVMRLPIFFLFSCVLMGMNCDVYYVPKITDSVSSCDNFKNEFIDLDDLKLGSYKGTEGDESAKLNGQMKTMIDITSNYDVEVDIWKVLDIADEFMYSSRINFCSSLDSTDSPWYPVIQDLKISSCPVPVSVFEVHSMTISLAAFKDVMCHDFCGSYRVQVSFMDATKKLSCHIIELSIVEVEDDEEEEMIIYQ